MTSILVADDDAGMREIVHRLLEEEGYRVIAATNGNEALQQLEEDSFHAVILDIRMPGLDGLEFISQVRRKYLGLPIIICTAHRAYSEDFRALGADAYILKEGDMSHLRHEVEKALNAAS